MKRFYLAIEHTVILLLILLSLPEVIFAFSNKQAARLNSDDMELNKASVTYMRDLELLVFQIEVKGSAGASLPTANGELNGAPVLGYVFPTTLKLEDVGFNKVDGIVALAVTSHPDFDDTPLWDENNDFNRDNDGVIFHSHWVVLVKDDRVPGGLSAKALDKNDPTVRTPGTFPNMPIYLDSPGFAIIMKGKYLKVLVPAQRINFNTGFSFDAVSAYMEVNTDKQMPMLGVYQVYDVLSDNLSLPYAITIK